MGNYLLHKKVINVKLFNGSNVIVEKPKIFTNGNYKDFGYGFYCTSIEKQAKHWAITKRNSHIVNVYNYDENHALKMVCFKEKNEEWLDFIVNCRRGIKHDCDIVEGPMADDTIWNYVEDYVNGEISRTAFWELVKFKYPMHQIVFCNETALKQIKYEGAITMTNKYFDDEEIVENDLFFMCYMIEKIARILHQRNKYVVNATLF